MLRNYLAIALRNIRQKPLYALINMFSLAIGLSSCMVIYLFIRDERSFDAFHRQRHSLYRVDEVQNFTGTNVQKVALTMGGIGPAMQHDFPEVTSYARFWGHGKVVLSKGDRQFVIDDVTAVDSSFLRLFDFDLLAGNRTTALRDPSSILLTEETALKFFPDVQAAMGNTLSRGEHEYKITGILKNVPENSHLQFQALISMATFIKEDPKFNEQWGGNFLNTYVLLKPHVDVKALEKKFPDFLIKRSGDKDFNKSITVFLQPLSEVHLGSNDIEHDYHNYRKFNGGYLGIFTVIGVFILLIAGVNFMNLTTARASHRWKEIGVRKTAGAKRVQLFLQFIFESTMLAFLALLLAGLLNILFIPVLNNLIGRQLLLSTLLTSPGKLLTGLAITAALGILTGIYPSFYMTSFSMSGLLKGGGKTEGKSVFRSALVVVQFGLALAMIVSTLVVVQQLHFMKTTDVGFDKDQIMLVGLNKESNTKFDVLKTELLRGKYIRGVTAAGQRLGNNFHQWGFKVKSDTGIMHITPSNVNVDYDYLKVYGIALKEGRSWSKEFANDAGKAFIINESLARELRLKNPIGTPAGHDWYNDDSLGTIIGIVSDFNFNSLHHKINTLSMVVHPDWGYEEMSVKVDGAHVQEAIAEVRRVWEANVSSYPFGYSFLDQHLENLYRSDQQMSAVVTIMATLAILISCMGLFGLAAITTERKIKEIGIRKALGATEGQITYLLSRKFALLILVSFLLASPLTWFLLSKWLQNFAYRIGINPLLFLLGGFVALAIALVTISYHTIRSARANPVKALRYE
jgi:putative ABC transport system permease protein